ncbi:hypothetical protein, partial [Escherichia coli]|uniref:hypothetical protein n=1 Tax=Escherichia coli TaxID=562 RepID=UPI001A8D8A06
LTDFGGKTSIFSHPVYLFLREFSLQETRGGSLLTGDTFVSVCGFVPRYFNSVEDLNSVSEISVVRLVNLVSFNR